MRKKSVSLYNTRSSEPMFNFPGMCITQRRVHSKLLSPRPVRHNIHEDIYIYTFIYKKKKNVPSKRRIKWKYDFVLLYNFFQSVFIHSRNILLFFLELCYKCYLIFFNVSFFFARRHNFEILQTTRVARPVKLHVFIKYPTGKRTIFISTFVIVLCLYGFSDVKKKF